MASSASIAERIGLSLQPGDCVIDDAGDKVYLSRPDETLSMIADKFQVNPMHRISVRRPLRFPPET